MAAEAVSRSSITAIPIFAEADAVPASIFPINQIWTLCTIAANPRRLSDRNLCFFSVLVDLDGQIQTMNLISETDKKLKVLWAAFYESIRTSSRSLGAAFTDLSAYFPRVCNSGLEEFSHTDLLLYENSKEQYMPINGITQSQYRNLKELYQSFMTRVIFAEDCPENDQNQFRSDIRMILSRPVGRDLIYQIVEYFKEDPFRVIYVESSDRSEIHYGNTIPWNLKYSRKEAPCVQVLSNGELRTLKNPSFIFLMHELCHLYFSTQKENVHTEIPNMDPFDLGPEEMRAIYGSCPCHPVHTFCENDLRKQFGLFQRKWHQDGNFPSSPRTQFRGSALMGLTGNLRALLEQGEVQRDFAGVVMNELRQTQTTHSRESFQFLLKFFIQKDLQKPRPAASDADVSMGDGQSGRGNRMLEEDSKEEV